MLSLTTQFDFSYFLQQPREVSSISADSVVYMHVKTFPVWFRNVTLEWTPLDYWWDKDPRYNIYRSPTEEGNYVKLNTTPIRETFFIDKNPWNSSKFQKYFYVIEIFLNNGEGPFRTPPVTTIKKGKRFQDLRAIEIQRRHWILLTKFTGMRTSVLRRKRHGPRCPECWDPVSNKVVKNYCTRCFNVGFDGGYYIGVPTFVQYDARIENKQYTYFGEFEANQIGAWTIAYPDINPHDLLIRHDDYKVYRVEQIQNTELLGRPVRQIMRITELAKEGVEYELIQREEVSDIPESDIVVDDSEASDNASDEEEMLYYQTEDGGYLLTEEGEYLYIDEDG